MLEQQPFSSPELKQHIASKPYSQIKEVKVNFRFLHIFIKEADKI